MWKLLFVGNRWLICCDQLLTNNQILVWLNDQWIQIQTIKHSVKSSCGAHFPGSPQLMLQGCSWYHEPQSHLVDRPLNDCSYHQCFVTFTALIQAVQEHCSWSVQWRQHHYWKYITFLHTHRLHLPVYIKDRYPLTLSQSLCFQISMLTTRLTLSPQSLHHYNSNPSVVVVYNVDGATLRRSSVKSCTECALISSTYASSIAA